MYRNESALTPVHFNDDVLCNTKLAAMVKRFGLRVRAFFDKTVRVCHVYCNFKLGFTCRITVFLEH